MSGILSWLAATLFAGRIAQDAAPPRTEPRAPRSRQLDGLRVSHRAASAFPDMSAAPTPFSFPRYPPGVLPNGATQIAQDQVSTAIQSVFDFGSQYHGLFAEGIGFQGFPYLSELSQRPEYRRAVEIIAEEMTRRWVKIKATGEIDKTEKVQELEDALQQFRVRDAFRKALEHDGYFGRGMLYLDYGQQDREELRTPLVYQPEKLGRGTLRAIKPIDPMWTGPNRYSATDPTRDDFYQPQSWFIMGREIHASRLLTIISRPLPDMLKPAYAFSGMSLSQLMKPYVDNWITTRQAVNDLLQSFTVFNLQTDLTMYLGGGDAGPEARRLDGFAAMRNNRGLLVTDKEREALENISAPLGTLDSLQAQAQEHLASVTGIPLVKLLGITPSGLNATAEPEMFSFYDHLHALQEKVLDDPLRIVLRLVQIDTWGEVDEEIDFDWVPLKELDELGKATLRKSNADTDAVLIGVGAIDPDEVRIRVAGELDSPYSGLDLTKPAPGPPVDPGMEDLFSGMGGVPAPGIDPTAQVVAAALAGGETGEDDAPPVSTPADALIAALSVGSGEGEDAGPPDEARDPAGKWTAGASSGVSAEPRKSFYYEVGRQGALTKITIRNIATEGRGGRIVKWLQNFTSRPGYFWDGTVTVSANRHEAGRIIDALEKANEQAAASPTPAASPAATPSLVIPGEVRVGQVRRINGKLMTIISATRGFPIHEDMPAIEGSHLLGHEGEYAHRVTYRPATSSEASSWRMEYDPTALKQFPKQYGGDSAALQPDPDDEELPETPADVVAVLGFDPLDETDTTTDIVAVIVQAIAKGT